MDHKLIGLLIGGVLAAIFLGFAGIFQKLSTSHGISLGPYITITGLSIALIGGIIWILNQDNLVTFASGFYASCFGAFWGAGSILIAIALLKYNANISQLVPLYNMNTLITVSLGLVIFGEYKNVSLIYLIPGSLSILVGGYLCARA